MFLSFSSSEIETVTLWELTDENLLSSTTQKWQKDFSVMVFSLVW